MLDAILTAFGYFYALSVIGAILYIIVACLRERNTLSQDEIDAEARRLIVEHGAEAVTAAEMSVQRAQWSKGRNTAPERTARVLKAVRQNLEL